MPPDEFLGPYKIGELIGRGGMGNVYEGQHATTGEKVAVKLIAAHVSDDPRFRRRFDREIRALKMLKHPGIVRIIGEGEDEGGRMFYSMELIRGETLQARIRRSKKLDWQTTIEIAIQVAAALKHAHDIGVTHRDLKPANLILTDDNRVKIVDFGIPKVFGDFGEQTQAGAVLGTPDYMAPEQAKGGPITPRTDLYSLGSVMYAMLLGRAPFKGKNSTEVIDALCRDRPVPLDLVDSNLPPDLVELVHHLLQKNPDDRPPTALAVLNRLKAMQKGLQMQATLSGDSSLTDGAGPSSGMSDTNIVDPITASSSEIRQLKNRPNQILESTQVSEPGTVPTDIKDSGKRKQSGPTIVAAGVKTVPGNPGDSGVTRQFGAPIESEQTSTETRARFSTVKDDSHTSSKFHSDEKATNSITHAMTILGMAAVLLFGGYAFYRATRQPTADKLYESIVESGQLATMNTFMRRFPDDRRFAEVRDMQREQRLSATLRRLSAQKKIGLVELDPAEESFISVMEKRQTDPKETSERLQQWINAFELTEQDPTATETANENRATMLELAKYELDAMARRLPRTNVDPRGSQLMDQVREAAAIPDAEAARKKLTGLIETFAEEDWAASAVAEARRRLEAL